MRLKSPNRISKTQEERVSKAWEEKLTFSNALSAVAASFAHGPSGFDDNAKCGKDGSMLQNGNFLSQTCRKSDEVDALGDKK